MNTFEQVSSIDHQRSSVGAWSGGVVILLKLCAAPDFVEFVLSRFSHFYIAIAYSNSTFCAA